MKETAVAALVIGEESFDLMARQDDPFGLSGLITCLLWPG